MQTNNMIDLSSLGQIATVEIDGRALRYLKAGSGRPLVLLHTIRTQLDYFHEAIPALAENTPSTRWTCPGMAIHRSIRERITMSPICVAP